MRAVICRRWCDYDELEIEDVPVPEPGPGEVLIRIAYCGVSFATQLVVAGKYQRKPPLPFSPGTDVVGEIAAVGAGVTRLRAGDPVVAAIDWGGYAEYVALREETVYPIPPGIEPGPALAAVPLSYGTSYGGLAWRARLQPGETLLVHGAAGGVGLAAVELGKALGARVIATASSSAKREIVLQHGADHVIATEGFREAVLALTEGRGVDVIYDPVGGDAFDQSLRCIAPDGRIVVIGFAGGRIQQVPGNLLLLKNASACGFNFGEYIGWSPVDRRSAFAARVQGMMADIFALMQAGQVRPRLAGLYPLAAFRDAMAELRARRSIGKVVLQI
ncbi:NADPH:quinone oxidoreductase family protein [Desertibaculum subflavum]|uniref:NADPH:quinone oxidoreductase family protein n=1 Tax=Desertibaculum subflavum TaxID=2268458 RepID=UPI000E669B41